MLEGRFGTLIAVALLSAGLPGCAAMRPMRGIPIESYGGPLPAQRRSAETSIDLSLLRQSPPPEHVVDSGDVLGIYIDGILGGAEPALPTYQAAAPHVKPGLGYPIEVRHDGTISLPYADPISVAGMTIPQVEARLRDFYTRQNALLQPGQDRVFVSLQRPRTYRVLVVRQEAGGRRFVESLFESTDLQQDKRGTGHVLRLPAYENDVLHALAETGGLPGLDAQNAIYIIRGGLHASWPSSLPPDVTIRGQSPEASFASYRAAPRPAGAGNGTYSAPQHPAVHAPPAGRSRESGGVPHGALVSQPAGNPAPHPVPQFPVVPHPPGGTSRGYSMPAGFEMRSPAAGQPDAVPQSAVVPHPPAAAGRYNGAHALEMRSPAVEEAGGRRAGDWAEAGTPAAGGWAEAGTPAGYAAEDWHHVPYSSVAPFPAAVPPVVTAFAQAGSAVVRIPLRMVPGTPPPFSPEDVLLYDGDIVFIEARDDEFFYSGGLLGGGRYRLPRDRDLDLVEAISIIEGEGRAARPTRSIGGSSIINQDVTVGASRVIIHRQLPDGTRVPLEVDLYEALRHPNQPILVQPEDRLYLSYARWEAPFAFIERHLVEGLIIGAATSMTFGR